MELMDTDLEKVLLKGPPLTGPEKKYIALCVAKGLKYLHSPYKLVVHGQERAQKPVILHRDLKAANVLLSYDRKTVKITDFGLGRTLQSWESAHSMVGTPYIRAPEVIRAGQINHEDEEEEEDAIKMGFGAAADVFSYGMLLYELLTGGLRPFHSPEGTVPKVVCPKILRGERPALKYIPNRAANDEGQEQKELVLVMQLCWQQDALLRPSMAKVVRWLSSSLSSSSSTSCSSLSLFETLQRELNKQLSYSKS
jgi:serine/threonine protein kinase